MATIQKILSNRNIFYGWWIVSACTMMNIVGSGVFFYGFSVFFAPMVLEFGWGRAITSGAFSLSRLEGAIEGPFIGWLIDKYGIRKLILMGVILLGLGFFVMTQIDSILMLYLIYGLLLSFGFNTAFSHTSNAAIANWFVKKRSRAFAIYTLGAGIGGTIGVSLLSRLIVNFGWRYAAMAAGTAVLAVCLPLALTVVHKPEQCGLLPDGIAQEIVQPHKDDAPAAANSISEPEFTLKEALKTSSFWVYTLGAVFRSVLLSSIVVHEIPHLMNVGFSEQVAGDILALMTFVSIPGRIVFGWAGDYFPKKYLLSISHILQAAGLYIFANVTSMEQAYLFVLLYGLGYGGAIPLVTAIRGDMFGRKSFATISGIVMPITTLGGVAGPIFAGYVYDITLSYQLAFYAFTVTALLAAVTFLFVKPPKNSKRIEDTQ